MDTKKLKISLLYVLLLSYVLCAKEELLNKNADLQTIDIKQKNESDPKYKFESIKAFSGCLAAVAFVGKAPLDEAIVACMTSVALALLVEKLGKKNRVRKFLKILYFYTQSKACPIIGSS